MNHRKGRVKVTQSADVEKRGNDEVERAKERYQDGLTSNRRPRSRKPNATVFEPEWIHWVLN